MGDYLTMSKKELERKTILEGFKFGKLSLKDCAGKLDLSYRQMKRVWRRYQQEADGGLCHRNRGKKPSNAYSNNFRDKILSLYQEKYLEFGPTFAAEKLLEDDGLKINAETLRLWLKHAGLWVKKRKRIVYRERRERRPKFGDLLQIDGSIHDWFSIGEKACLLNMVDDATGISFALLDTGETTKILLTCFKAWIQKYGIPKAVYVDLKSVYVGFKPLKEKYDDDLLVKEGFSYFEQACRKLGVEIIRAYSPQAKGRVERKHGVYQDRLVKDLKLYGIKNIEAGNKYLEDVFLEKVNKKFGQAPTDPVDGHRDPTLYGDLDEILCWSYKRQLRNDWSIQFNREYYQIRKPGKNKLQPGDFVIFKKYLDGSLGLWHEGQKIDFGLLSRKPEPASKKKKSEPRSYDSALLSKNSRENKHKSPWSKGFHFGKNQPLERYPVKKAVDMLTSSSNQPAS